MMRPSRSATLPLFCAAVAVFSTSNAHGALLRRDRGAAGPKLVAFLSTKADELASVELTVLAHKARLARDSPGGLDQVKDMIRNMISQKQTELASSVTKSQYCDKEMPKAKAELEKVKDQIDESSADHDRLAAKMAAMKEENEDIAAAIAHLHKNISDSQAFRDKEHAAYAEVKAKYEDPKRAASEEALREQIAVEREEAGRLLAFNRAQAGAEVAIKQKEKTAKLNEASLIKMNTELAETDKDARLQQDLLASATSYKRQLEKQCVVRAETHEERKRRRDEEIESMKDAYVILGGEPS